MCAQVVRNHKMTSRCYAYAVLVAIVTFSCARGESADTLSAEPLARIPPTTTKPMPNKSEVNTSAPSLGQFTLDEQITWVVDLLNGETVNEDEVAARFSAAGLEELPPKVFLDSLDAYRGGGETWSIGEIAMDDEYTTVSLSSDVFNWLMYIKLDSSGAIDDISIDRESFVNPPDSFEEIRRRLNEHANVKLLAANVSSGTCEHITAIDPDSPQPIGSSFKLYVLAALRNAVAMGKVSWNDSLTIRDGLKSLPTGTFQDLDAGTERTVLEFAKVMISDSDNTATDHLIDLLGREAVESVQAMYGHSDPSLNIPFLTTREFFLIKLVYDQEERDAYIAANATERRRILNNDLPSRGFEGVQPGEFPWPQPINIGELEWFASAMDICRALVLLHADARDQSFVREIMGAVPGFTVDEDKWSYVGYKDGREPGVIHFGWYLERSDGEKFVYTVGISNETDPIGIFPSIPLVGSGVDLLAGS